jgi:hypothetical protein
VSGRRTELECALQSHPTYAQVTLSVLAHAGAAIVNALWAYI